MCSVGSGPLKEHRKPPVSDRDGFQILPFRQAFLKATEYAKDVYQVSSISLCILNCRSLLVCDIWYRMIICESHETSREIYKRTGAKYDRRSATMWRMQIGMAFTMYGVLCLTVFSNFDGYKL